MDKRIQIRNSTTDFLVFTKQNGEDGIEVRVHDENVWLTQKSMAQLFDCSTDNISLHLKNIFASGELVAEAVTEKSSATASDGKKYTMNFIIWMLLFLLIIGSIPFVLLNSGNGRRKC